MKDFDELLDGVLHEMSSVAPLDGIEHRVMHRVRASRQTAVRWRQGFAAAMVLAAGVVVFAVWPGRTVVRPVSPVRSAQVASSVAEPAQVPAQPRIVRTAVKSSVSRRREVGRGGQGLPKLDVFPTPVPVSPEMAMLMDYTLRHPEEAEALVKTLAAGETAIRPIKIEPIRIPAIEMAALAPLP